MSIQHSVPADSTFSVTGAAAWNANHVPSANIEVTAPTGVAATDTATLQTALNSAGVIAVTSPGTYLINAVLRVKNNTTLIIGPGVTIKQAPNTKLGMLKVAAFGTTATTITFSWTSTLVAPINWTNHGLDVTDYVWIQGATNGIYNQVFRVNKVVDANTIEVLLPRLPTANAAGTIKAVQCTKNIIIDGGVWDYDFANNNTGGSGDQTDKNTFTIGPAGNVTIKNVTFRNGNHWSLFLGAVADVLVEKCSLLEVVGENCKIYGPASHIKIRDCRSLTKDDDGMSIQAKEADAFSAYRWTFGDVYNVEYDNIQFVGRNDAATANGALIIFASTDEIISGIKIRNITPYHENSANSIAIKYGQVGFTGAVDDVSIENWHASTNNAVTPLVCYCNIHRLELKNVTYEPDATGTTAFMRRENFTIDNFVVDGFTHKNTAWPASAASLFDWSNNAGGFGSVTLKNFYIRGSSNLQVFFIGGTPTIGSITIENCDMEGITGVGQFSNGANYTTCTVLGGRYKTLYALMDARKNMTFSLIGASFDTFSSNQIIRANSTGTIILTQTGCFINGGMAPIGIGGAGPVILPYGFEIQVDVGATGFVKTTSGQYCFNTSAGGARGTLVANRLVTCNGTNWIQVDDNTKTF